MYTCTTYNIGVLNIQKRYIDFIHIYEFLSGTPIFPAICFSFFRDFFSCLFPYCCCFLFLLLLLLLLFASAFALLLLFLLLLLFASAFAFLLLLLLLLTVFFTLTLPQSWMIRPSP